MKSPLRILHTSDIHLDNQIGTGADLSPGQIGMMAVVDAAIEQQADLFLLAGDLFDHNRIKQPCLDFVTEQLARISCPVLIITGNHDSMAEYSIFDTYDPCEAGAHIVVLRDEPGEVHRLDSLGVTVWARGIVDHHPEYKPLEHIPDHEHDGWYLGMSHGHYVEGHPEDIHPGARRSSQITSHEIAASDLDYLALGHVHVFQTMQHGRTLAAYAGSPNLGQGAKEMTAALVTLCPDDGVNVEKLVFG